MKKQTIILLVLLLIFIFNLRLDQFDERYLTSNDLSDIIDTSSREVNFNFLRTGAPHPSFYYLFMHFWNKIFGIGEIVSRIPMVIFGVLCIILTYKLACLLFNEKIAIISSLFMAINPYLAHYSQIVEKYAMFMAFSLLSFYFFIKFLDKDTFKNSFFYFLSTLLLIHTHFYGSFVILVELLYTILNKKYIGKAKLIIFTCIVAAITFIPMIVLIFKYGPYDFPYTEIWHDMLPPLTSSPFYFLYFLIIKEGLKWYGGIMLVVTYILMLTYFKKFKKDYRKFIVLWFFLCPLIFIIISFFACIQHYQVLFMLPFFIIFMSKSIFFIENTQLRAFLILIFVALSVFGLYDYYTAPRESPMEIINYMNSNFEADDLIIADGFQAFTIRYYSDLPFRALYFQDLADPNKLSQFKRQYERFWLIYNIDLRRNDYYFFNNSTIKWLKDNCNATEIHDLYLC